MKKVKYEYGEIMNSKHKGMKFENKVQKCINSGAIYFDPGDLKTDNALIECKFTDKKSYRIPLKVLEKLWEEALDSNKLPRLVIGIRRNNEEVFIINGDVSVERIRR